MIVSSAISNQPLFNFNLKKINMIAPPNVFLSNTQRLRGALSPMLKITCGGVGPASSPLPSLGKDRSSLKEALSISELNQPRKDSKSPAVNNRKTPLKNAKKKPTA
jgi:hypothetical protein